MGNLKNVNQHTGSIADNRDGTLINLLLSPVDNALANRAINTPGIVIGSASAAKVKIGNATACMINGKLVLIAGQEVAFTATTDDIADGYINVFLVTVNAAGTVALEGGQAALIASGAAAVVLPEVAANKAVIGFMTVSTLAAAFDASTTLLSAGTVTDLYYDNVGPWAIR